MRAAHPASEKSLCEHLGFQRPKPISKAVKDDRNGLGLRILHLVVDGGFGIISERSLSTQENTLLYFLLSWGLPSLICFCTDPIH